MTHSILRALLKEYFSRSTAYCYALHEDDKVRTGSSADAVNYIANDMELQADRVIEAFKSFENGELMYKAFNSIMIRRIWAHGAYISGVIRNRSSQWSKDAKKRLDDIDEQIDIMIGVLK
ncbi:hypothetical protein ACQ46_gp213 [Citrobacter phage Moon]|uniref:Uncharacterized protein n=1 Tax=Citrobacter phage Moon TaxID=1540095 RepID=A0A0A0YQF0_9CAUD|nr:hypothetical protein ACQ46_gp213 [Citrobacter phage Moon]AIX12211.1 hypothetical protein CPT_Moon240 [Citrobacter phage Moon]